MLILPPKYEIITISVQRGVRLLNITKTISRFLTDRVGGIYIKNENTGKIVYADDSVKQAYEGLTEGSDASQFLSWEYDDSDYKKNEVAVFDQYDVATRRFLLVRILIFDEDEVTYRIGEIVDVSSVMELQKDVAESVSFLREMDQFKTSVLSLLSKPFYMLIPIIKQYVTGSDTIIVRKFGEICEWYSYQDDNYITNRDTLGEKTKEALEAEEGDFFTGGLFGDDKYACIFGGHIANTTYAVFGKCVEDDKKKTANPLLIHNLKLYLENGFMREEIVYESEHDKMTGLYNKGKYIQRCKEEYPYLDSIAIMNFDVNNLKKINDNLGHEYGDLLLKRAADSIAKVCTLNHIHGYRMGGDEYLLVIANPKDGELDKVVKDWEKGLEELNKEAQLLEDEKARFQCVVAVGAVEGKKPYNYEELMHRADELMYEDKKRKKKPGEEIR